MQPEMISASESDGFKFEDELADFTADLLALRTNESILHRLFANPRGQWSNLTSLLENHNVMSQQLVALQKDCQGTLKVTWLEHPELEQGCCLVLFYLDSLGWNSLALYNKARLGLG